METSNYLYSSLLLSSFLFLFYLIRNKRCTNNRISFADAIRNNHRFLDWATDLVLATPTATVTMFGGAILTANPSNVEHIMKTNFDNYPHGPASTAIMADLLGHGIFNSDGEQWHHQRRIAAVEFNSRTFRSFVTDTVASQIVTRLLPSLSSSASSVIDLQDTLDRFAFDNVCKVAFGVDPCRLSLHDGTSEGDTFARSFEQAAAAIAKRFTRPRLFWSATRFLDIGTEKGMKRHLAILNGFAAKIVTERKKNRDKDTGNDLLSRFMKAGDFPDEFLRDVMLNYVLAGRDTTSSAMSWFFWLVSSNNSAIEENILKEITSIRRRKHGGSEDAAFTVDELREMSYLHAAISEAMRLYPPVALESRTNKEADVLPDGTKVAKGSRVLHSPYIMGRMESIWGEDCREFKPERWLEDGVFQPRSPYQYPVFHAGPRMCLGKDMAYAQMKAVVASVMEKFVIEVIEKGEREQDLSFVLRMKKGLPVRISAR